jgi:lipoyl synthase
MTAPDGVAHLDRVPEIIKGLDISDAAKKEMLRSFKIRLDSFSNNILFFNEPFTPVSVTGTDCELNCKHCEKHYLEHMLDGSGGKLRAAVVDLAKRGRSGVLLSGGSKLDGSVPTYELSDEIRQIKDDTHLKMSAHTGIITPEQALSLSTWLDMALVDCIGSDAVISGILGLPNTVSDYENTLRFLTDAGIPIAPHIIVGLNNGALDGEFRAVEMVKKYDPDVVVIVVFIPTKNTACASAPPPALEDVVSVIAKARQEFPQTPLSLSCVRPGGRYRSRLDECAILSGIDRIAVPSRSAYQLCAEIGLDIHEVDNMCCSYPLQIRGQK